MSGTRTGDCFNVMQASRGNTILGPDWHLLHPPQAPTQQQLTYQVTKLCCGDALCRTTPGSPSSARHSSGSKAIVRPCPAQGVSHQPLGTQLLHADCAGVRRRCGGVCAWQLYAGQLRHDGRRACRDPKLRPARQPGVSPTSAEDIVGHMWPSPCTQAVTMYPATRSAVCCTLRFWTCTLASV